MASQAVSIIVPTFREAQNIPVLAERLFATMKQADIAAELIIVDDDSHDGTDATVAKLVETHPIRLITRTEERGLSSAVVRGFAEAKHNILLCMDADLSHPPESVPDVIRPILEGRAEFCIGSRYTQGGTATKDW